MSQPARIGPTTNLLLARALRDFGDGFVSVLLPVYLLGLGFNPVQVGVIASAALLGSALLTLGVGLIGAGKDHRTLLLIASAMMVASGLVYACAPDYAVLVVVAFVGTINPSGGSASIFIPLEHAVLAREVPDRGRTTAFSRYSLVGALAGAFGALFAATPEALSAFGIDKLPGIKLMFVGYAVLGALGGLMYARIPRQVLAPDESVTRSGLGPSRGVVYRLAVLFSIDSFAGGFVVQSILALWLFERFDLSLAQASVFFFWTGVLSAFSFPVAAWLATRIGLVNTMVYTHIPSSVCLILAAFAPNLVVCLLLLLVRSALSQMDVPTRSSYVMAVVTPPERTAAASVTAVPRSLAAAASPALAGALVASGFSALPLLICGVLKIGYDVLLLFQFRHVKPPEEM